MLKSPTLAEAMKPLGRLESEAKAQYEEDTVFFEAELEAFKAHKEALKSDMQGVAKGKHKDKTLNMEVLKDNLRNLDEPEAPIRKRYRTNDSMIEKLGELLNENPRGILVFRDELIGLLCSWDREDRKQDRSFYLESWNGSEGFTADRIGRGTVDIKNCCLSILGGIQPSKLMGYLQQAKNDVSNDGMIQRFQLLDQLIDNGGFLLEKQVMELDSAIKLWKEYYDMSEQQIKLLNLVYERKIANPSDILILSTNEIVMIGINNQEGLNESKVSFKEINIEWEDYK